jgi:transcriptional antiterminator NusG
MKNDLKWYVLKVVSGQEKAVKASIDIEVERRKLNKYFDQVIIPLGKVYEVRAGKRTTRERNFLPGYVIVHVDLSDGSVSHLIKEIPYALGLLGARGCGANVNPIPMRDKEVDKILGNTIEISERVDECSSSFLVGETVKIIDGPFSGFSGTIQEVFEERKKLNVIVKIFERDTPLELAYWQTEKMS